ncbi:hypothetical protein M419DRAFT_10163 [Trichoderma reesei RUT C-30]|uniref:Uncharacterized protein n=1 Tax=Hypocrea jecorina (strain ATCC 56765 / BCRC 32924 / NRRL 11460 / Rut C-30) TaxID=1344414 RepID=A0A024S6H0_HYPJR|nr:hypothetical protein M419DRAFT_10163 [Trichoderma reesei RUT C-30]
MADASSHGSSYSITRCLILPSLPEQNIPGKFDVDWRTSPVKQTTPFLPPSYGVLRGAVSRLVVPRIRYGTVNGILEGHMNWFPARRKSQLYKYSPWWRFKGIERKFADRHL